MVTGAIISGMGASAFLFNMLDTAIVNPLALNMEGGVFPAVIYSRWAPLLRKLGLIYGALAVTGALLQRNPPSHQADYPIDRLLGRRPAASAVFGKGAKKGADRKGAEATVAPPRSLASDVFSLRFGVMWLMILNSAVSGLNVAGSYKTFGTKQPQLNSDTFLSLVGSLSAIFGNAAGRFFWGGVSDVAGFKRPFVVLTLLQSATMLSYARLARSRATFALATIVMLFCMGGNFAMFPAQTLREFGANGARVYSFLFTGFGSAALMGPILGNYLLSKGGFELLYTTLGLLSLVSTALASATF